MFIEVGSEWKSGSDFWFACYDICRVHSNECKLVFFPQPTLCLVCTVSEDPAGLVTQSRDQQVDQVSRQKVPDRLEDTGTLRDIVLELKGME